MTSDHKNMGVDTSTRLFRCLLLEILRKIVISTMATTNLHINGFLQKYSRMPEWHQSEYSFRWSGDHKNAEKHCADPNARSSWKMVFDIRTTRVVQHAHEIFWMRLIFYCLAFSTSHGMSLLFYRLAFSTSHGMFLLFYSLPHGTYHIKGPFLCPWNSSKGCL